jgi:hypothetical protein
MIDESPPTASRSETNGRFLFFFQSDICFRCRLDNPQFSATDNWCDSWFLHSSFPWQSQMLVHDKFCSTQTQFLLQMDLPLHIHTRSCKKSDVMGPSKYFGINYLFSFLHPYSKGDLGGGLASLACVHTFGMQHKVCVV